MEIGRVALVNYGKEYGRLVVIVDIVDQNRVCFSFLLQFIYDCFCFYYSLKLYVLGQIYVAMI